MRGANAYQPLHETHEQIEAETVLPGTRYEPLRDTQRELDAEQPPQQQEEPTRPEIARFSIDAVEARLAALDQELTDMREAGRSPEHDAPSQEDGLDNEIERTLALQDQPSPEGQSPEANTLEDYVAPERWTDRGGMVEQQASAMEWLEHSREERLEPAAAEERGPAANELTADDLAVLDAAREREAQNKEQELTRVHTQDYPAP